MIHLRLSFQQTWPSSFVSNGNLLRESRMPNFAWRSSITTFVSRVLLRKVARRAMSNSHYIATACSDCCCFLSRLVQQGFARIASVECHTFDQGRLRTVARTWGTLAFPSPGHGHETADQRCEQHKRRSHLDRYLTGATLSSNSLFLQSNLNWVAGWRVLPFLYESSAMNTLLLYFVVAATPKWLTRLKWDHSRWALPQYLPTISQGQFHLLQSLRPK